MASGDAGTRAPHVALSGEQGMVAQAGCMFECATGRLTRLIHCLALVSLGFGVVMVVRMIDGAGIGEQLSWMGGAWLAWVAIIALKLWVWSRDHSFADPAEAFASEAADDKGELQAQPV